MPLVEVRELLSTERACLQEVRQPRVAIGHMPLVSQGVDAVPQRGQALVDELRLGQPLGSFHGLPGVRVHALAACQVHQVQLGPPGVACTARPGSGLVVQPGPCYVQVAAAPGPRLHLVTTQESRNACSRQAPILHGSCAGTHCRVCAAAARRWAPVSLQRPRTRTRTRQCDLLDCSLCAVSAHARAWAPLASHTPASSAEATCSRSPPLCGGAAWHSGAAQLRHSLGRQLVSSSTAAGVPASRTAPAGKCRWGHA